MSRNRFPHSNDGHNHAGRSRRLKEGLTGRRINADQIEEAKALLEFFEESGLAQALRSNDPKEILKTISLALFSDEMVRSGNRMGRFRRINRVKIDPRFMQGPEGETWKN